MNSQEQNQLQSKEVTEKKPDGKGEASAPIAIKPPVSPRDSQFSSVFDSCIPGGMLMYPVTRPPQRDS